jgi:phosphoglycerate dehydrogenase-like enzyme
VKRSQRQGKLRPKLVVCAGQALFDSFFPAPQKKQLGRNFDWVLDGSSKQEYLAERLSTAQALITTWDSPRFSDELLRLAPELQIIAHCGGEVKSRFSQLLFKKLTITNSADPMAQATAEMGAAFLLYGARNIDFYREAMKAQSNQVYEDLHLHGNNVAFVGAEIAMIGFGRIGRALVQLLRGFDLKWSVYDPYVSKADARKYSITLVPFEKLIPQARLLVLTAALTEETRSLLNRKVLARIPDGAFIVNIARGGLLDLDSLVREVKNGRLRCALDVTDPLEPLPVNHPIRNLPGAMVTPHIAASNLAVRWRIADVVLNDLERFFTGEGVENRVTIKMLERMT